MQAVGYNTIRWNLIRAQISGLSGSYFARLAIPVDEVSTESGSDRVSTLHTVEIARTDPGATALGTDLIAWPSPDLTNPKL